MEEQLLRNICRSIKLGLHEQAEILSHSTDNYSEIIPADTEWLTARIDGYRYTYSWGNSGGIMVAGHMWLGDT